MADSLSPFWTAIWSNTERERLLLSCPALMALSFQVVMGGLLARQREYDCARWKQIEEEEEMEVVVLHSHGGASEDEEEEDSIDRLLFPPFQDPLRESRRVKDQVHVLLSFVEPSALLCKIFPEMDLLGWQKKKESVDARADGATLDDQAIIAPHDGHLDPPPPPPVGETAWEPEASQTFWSAMRFVVERLWHANDSIPSNGMDSGLDGRKRCREDTIDEPTTRVEERMKSERQKDTSTKGTSAFCPSHWSHYLYPILSSSASGPFAFPSASVDSYPIPGDPQLVFALSPFSSPSPSLPLPMVSFMNAVQMSEKVLRLSVSAALSASVQPIPPTMKGLVAVLLTANIVEGEGGTGAKRENADSKGMLMMTAPTGPTSPSSFLTSPSTVRPEGHSRITAEGLNFCMMAMPQQWWVLLQGALTRLFQRQRTSNTPSIAAEAVSGTRERESGSSTPPSLTKATIWQRLGILALAECTTSLYPFPSKEEDPIGFLLLARLSEIGLIYAMKVPPASTAMRKPADGRSGPAEAILKGFVVSPYLRHALHWGTASPLCATSMLAHSKEVEQTRDGGEGAAERSSGKDCKRGVGSPVSTLQQLRQQELDTIITETNYRLYVYSVNPDLLRLVGMFAEREEVVNGGVLTCYRITRHSFAAALRKGLTATEILQFLSSKAHPSMTTCYGETTRSTPSSSSSFSFLPDEANPERETVGASHTFLLPPSIVDQLQMWEREQHRVTFQPQVTLLQNMTVEQKKLVRTILQDYGETDAIVHEEVGVMIIREDAYDRLLERHIST